MRHRKKVKKLGRKAQHRKAVLKNLFSSLLKEGRIKTSEAKGKALVQLANSLMEKAKRGDLHSRRLVSSYITSPEVSKKFFQEILPNLSARQGGYLRMVRVGRRKGDGALLVQIELLH